MYVSDHLYGILNALQHEHQTTFNEETYNDVLKEIFM